MTQVILCSSSSCSAFQVLSQNHSFKVSEALPYLSFEDVFPPLQIRLQLNQVLVLGLSFVQLLCDCFQ